MSTPQASIASAVSLALAPQSSQQERQEAYNFLEQIKSRPLETYAECLKLFLAQGADAYPGEARLFCLQVVDEALGNDGNPHLEPAATSSLQSSFFDYVTSEFLHGTAEGTNVYLKNKIGRTLFLLFYQTYQSSWPDFFNSFAGLLRPASDQPLNYKTTDLYLRLLHEISTELSDSGLRLNKPYSRMSKDAAMRDVVRERDASNIALSVFSILAECLSTAATNATAADLVEQAIKVAGDFVAWIDINLIISPDSTPLIYQALQLPTISIRMAVAETLIETVAKGMPGSDKLKLIQFLNLHQVLTNLVSALTASKKESEDLSDDQEAFMEKLAKLLNVVGSELAKIADDAVLEETERKEAKALLMALSDLLLAFLSDEYDDTASAVIPLASSILSLFKKEKKKDQQGHLTPEKTAFLNSLLQVVLRKMQYATEEEWGGGDDEDDEEGAAHFAELRKNLKTLFDAVAVLSEEIFIRNVRDLIIGVLDTLDSGNSASLSWQQVELVLYVLYLYGEAMKGSGVMPTSFVILPPGESKKKNNANSVESLTALSQYPLSPLGELILRTTQSSISGFPHPSVPLQYFECVVRYHDFFVINSTPIPGIIQAFLDQRGLHQDSRAARSRCFYLFHRFIFYAREQIQKNVSVEFISEILNAIQDLLVIEVEPLPQAESDDDPLVKAAHGASRFDSQLYLFECVGTLVHTMQRSPNEQAAILQMLVDSLITGMKNNIRANISSMEDLQSVLRLHHYILAVGNLAKGFPTLSATTEAATGAWVEIFKVATQAIIDSLKQMSGVLIIREAALGAFKIIVATLGKSVLPFVEPLLECLISEMKAQELIDFLPFLALLLVRYKDDCVPLLEAIIYQIYARVYTHLEQAPQGTDEAFQHSELRRAYFAINMAIFNANMQNIFLTESNKPYFEGYMNSILHYTTSHNFPADTKAGFLLLTRLASTWIPPIDDTVVPTTNGKASPVPAATIPNFEQFFYSRVLQLCFEIPLKKSFDYTDAQSFNVLGEIAALLKTLEKKRGDEFRQQMSSVTFPAVGYPPEKAQEFLAALASAPDGKTFKKVLSRVLLPDLAELTIAKLLLQFFAPLMQEAKKRVNVNATAL